MIDRVALEEHLAAERATYRERTPGSRALFEQADHLFGRVPMTWMNKWSGGYPLYLSTARGNRITDVDGTSMSTSPWATRVRWQAIHRSRPSRRCTSASVSRVGSPP